MCIRDRNNTEHKKDLEDGKKVNKLKKPASAFILYSMQKRKEIVEENPELGLGAVGKLLGEKWKALTEEEQGVVFVLKHRCGREKPPNCARSTRRAILTRARRAAREVNPSPSKSSRRSQVI
eukprot:TRINITY_DN1652_c0_g1_i28.p2 TRINITY_DN1652_c0_g1~~TRINITY_DN1652_c0_g1_i28.p2  ORF type:complete len:122 (+),score=28.42 TRINITY_DN1652_c0_g1_i28:72-437(+)